jgi:hypothetical protein
LYLLKYNDNNRKRVFTVDNRISDLDTELQKFWNSTSSAFRSIGSVYDGPSSKVKAIPNDERLSDEHFCDIFDVSVSRGVHGYPMRDGVLLWTKQIQQDEDILKDGVRDAEDLLVQQQAMEEHPEAFGGSSSMVPGSSGKRRAEVSSIDQSKKIRFSSDGDSAGCEEVQRLREELDGFKVENEELKKELSAANATVEQMVSVIVCFPSLGSIDQYPFRRTPFRSGSRC